MFEESEATPFAGSLLKTKLFRPRLPHKRVARPQLLERLNQGLQRSLTLVSAPAGYGKSTLVNQWLDHVEQPAAWLSLDEYDANLDIFVAYVLAALQEVHPAFGEETGRLLSAVHPASPGRLADALLRDLEAVPERTILVLDDYHAITDASVQECMVRLTEQLPRSLHLVLITRADPPFSLMRLRGQGRMHEIRANQLRFNRRDAADFLATILEEPPQPEVVDLLAERTEGWPAGLRMAAISLQDSRDEEAFLERFSAGNNRLLMDYMVSEVLGKLPAAQQQMLLRMSLLERFCASLLAQIGEPPVQAAAAQAVLDDLWRANLFLVALDEEGIWYRYHHLFRDLLRHRLNTTLAGTETRQLFDRASRWYEEAGLIEEAINYALEGGNALRAATLVEQNLHEALNLEEWRRVERWLALLPEEVLDRPGITAAQLVVNQIRYQVPSMEALLATAQKQLDSQGHGYTPQQIRHWQGILNTYRSTLFMPRISAAGALESSSAALQQLPAAAQYVRGLAELWHILSLQMSGRRQDAVREAEALLQNQQGVNPARIGRWMLALGGVYYDEGDVTGVLNTGLIYRRFAERTGLPLNLGWSAFLLGWARYQQNDLAGAEQFFAQVLQLVQAVHVRTAVDSMIGQTLTFKAQGRDNEALRMLGVLRDFLVEREALVMLPLTETLAWRLGLGEERPVATTSGLSPAAIHAQLAADLWELPVLTAARADIESMVPDRLAAAESALGVCTDFALSRHASRVLVRIGALQAQLCEARGQHEAALTQLAEAVERSAAGGALRDILDTAPALYPLIQTLHDRGVSRSYLGRMLDAFRPPEPRLLAEVTGEGADAVALAGILTYREIEVLLLVEKRLSNQQIAQKLFLSPHTVKKHTVNVYRKLSVSNRREAVARARALRLLPDNPAL